MRFKLDENFGNRTVSLFRDSGHDVHTVLAENLSGAPDSSIFEAVIRENRCLVTLDVDFANVLRFPPHATAGIAVIRLSKNTSTEGLSSAVRRLLIALQAGPIAGRLWVIEPTRIRVHAKTGVTED